MNSVTEGSRYAGRMICLPFDRTVAASAYGRSAPASRATVNTTNSTTGSVMVENVLARLDPSALRVVPLAERAITGVSGGTEVTRMGFVGRGSICLNT